LAAVMKGNSLIGVISASRLLELALQPSWHPPRPRPGRRRDGRRRGAGFVAAYILIATERVPKMVTALVGAGIILGLGLPRRRRCSTPTRRASTGTLSSGWAGVSGGDQSHTPDGKAARAERGGRGNLVPCLRSSVLHHRCNTSRW